MEKIAFIAGVIGFVLLIAGVGAIYWPAGLIVAGAGLLGWSALVARSVAALKTTNQQNIERS